MRTFHEILDSAGFEPDSYSGRGMFGRQCLSVSLGRDESLSRFWAEVIETCDDDSEIQTVVRGMKAACTEGLGYGIVVFWPKIQAITDSEGHTVFVY